MKYVHMCYQSWAIVKDSIIILQGDTTYLIYSYHSKDPVNNEQFLQHQFQGTKTINLFGQPESVPSLPSDVQYFDIANSNVSNLTVLLCIAISIIANV